MESVLVGLDPPTMASEPLRWAAEYCRLTGAELVAVVTQPLVSQPPREWYEAELARLRKQAEAALDALSPAIPHRLETCEGDPSSVMAGLAGDEGAGLVVVGAPGSDGFRALALGTHQLPVPLVIVPSSDRAPLAGPVVVGLDGSSTDGGALAWAVRLAEVAEASVVAVYAADPAAMSHPLQPGARAIEDKQTFLGEHVAAAVRPGVDIATRVEDTDAVTALTGVSDQVGASLVVVGRGGEGQPGGVVVGRVPAELSFEAQRPIVIVPPARRVEGL